MVWLRQQDMLIMLVWLRWHLRQMLMEKIVQLRRHQHYAQHVGNGINQQHQVWLLVLALEMVVWL
jgi:phage-related protein